MTGIRSLAVRVLRKTLGPRRTLALQKLKSDTGILARSLLTRDGYHSTQVLRRFKDRYSGRCVIIGNGPSLQRTDLSKLQGEVTFGLNRIYLLFEERRFTTEFLVSVNRYVIEQCAQEIERQPCTKFLGWGARRSVRRSSNTAFVQSAHIQGFSKNPIREGAYEGATVTYVAMQLAFFMGFREVVLVGVDHSFSTKGPPHTVVTSSGDDPNHFDPNYFGRGFKWQLPDLEASESAYKMADEAFKRAGGRVVDATIGGELRVFEKVDFTNYFSKG